MTTMTTTTMQASDLLIEEFTLRSAGSHGRPLHFSTDEREVYPKNPHRGERAGTIVVRVGDDFDHDMVAMEQGHCSQLALLDTVIADLQVVRDTLATLTPTAALGRCTNGAEWGQCLLADGHEQPCEGQTEDQWRATEVALAAVRTRGGGGVNDLASQTIAGAQRLEAHR